MAVPLSTKLILSAAAIVTLWPATADSPVHASRRSANVSVTVEHRLVDAYERPVRATPAPRRRAPLPARPAVVQLAAAPSRSAGVVARAGRLLLGDGRFRPEPFPRPGR